MSLKQATASTLKWNTIDRLASQAVYGIVGIVLARVLSKEDFGLVGVLAIFQAFALVVVDSGLGAALLRLKRVGKDDYSTVFWFNLAVSVAIYFLLWFAAPLIADFFQNDRRLIPLSKVMFLAFVLNGLAIVQTNRLMKKMRVRKLAVANLAGLSLGGMLGIWLALRGAGPWALVWQVVAQAGIRSAWLWCSSGWYPRIVFSRASFDKVWRVGMGVFSSSFLNTLFLNIYSVVIGGWYTMSTLGLYTQADKWSKMGSAALSQTLMSSFVPLLARVQDDGEAFARYVKRINRFTAFVAFPALCGMAVAGTPLFHTLFGHKWDEAIGMFQILSVRGIPIVLVSLYTNYLLSLGYARSLVAVEVVKDGLLVAAIFCTVWSGDIITMVWGQLGASLLTFGIVLIIVCRRTGFSSALLLKPFLPFALMTAGACAIALAVLALTSLWAPVLRLGATLAAGALSYFGMLRMLRVPELAELGAALRGKLK